MQSNQDHSASGYRLPSYRLHTACVVYAMVIVFELTLQIRRLTGGFQPTEFSRSHTSVMLLVLLAGVGCYYLLPEVFRRRNSRTQMSLAIASILPAIVLAFLFLDLMSASTQGGVLFLSVTTPVFLFFIDRRPPIFDSPLTDFSPIETSLETTPFEKTEQSLKRWFGEDRTDCMEGTATARFVPNQKHANVHVPFQPSFESVPEVECYETSDASCHLKVAEVRRYGMRIELQCSEHLDSSRIVKLHFEAVAQTKTDSVSA